MLKREHAESWLKEAGALALRYFRKVKPSIKDDKTYVTEADLAVQSLLKEKIVDTYPQVGIISEENFSRKPQDGETYFVLDPIDGTAMFVSGLPLWGIALGVIKSGKPIAGYFYMPATDDFYYTETDGPVYLNKTKTGLKPFDKTHSESVLLTVSRAHKRFDIKPDYPGKVRCLGSTQAHICYVATGSADVALVSGSYIWDLAAGVAMLYRNGGTARYFNGDQFFFLEELFQKRKLALPVLLGQDSSIQYFIENVKCRWPESGYEYFSNNFSLMKMCLL
ncbi:MAG: inositol monophosphatase, partial [Desulfosarcina sp.]|nr:inositol monophosphatase [Desulfobacterales bacterium]